MLYFVTVVCETPGCERNGEVINTISELEEESLDIWFEDYNGESEEADWCIACGQPGIAQDPQPMEFVNEVAVL